MAKFNYNIYYKDAQTGQDLASPVMVEYDSFNTAISATQKQFSGYTQRELWENQKKTPSESTYNNRQEVRDYQQRLYEYNRDVQANSQVIDRINNLKQYSNYKDYGDIAVWEEYDYSRAGSYAYYDRMKLFTSNENVDALARPISWSFNSREVDWSGRQGAPNVRPGYSARITGVSSTVSGKRVDIIVRVNNFRRTSFSDANPGLWIHMDRDSGGIKFNIYDIYEIDLTMTFVDSSGYPITTAILTSVVDIDYKQYIDAYVDGSTTVIMKPPGSQLSSSAGTVSDDYGNVYSGASSVPRGSYAFAGIGSKINMTLGANSRGRSTIYNPQGEHANDSWEISFFGNASRGEVFAYKNPVKPTEPSYTEDITILYDRVAKIRPWAIRNSGSWKSFVTKDIHMARRTHDSWDKSSTEINVEQVGQVIPRDPRFGYVEPAGSGVIRGNYIRKDGNWKRQGKIGS